jgi:hypothetical protein
MTRSLENVLNTSKRCHVMSYRGSLFNVLNTSKRQHELYYLFKTCVKKYVRLPPTVLSLSVISVKDIISHTRGGVEIWYHSNRYDFAYTQSPMFF